MYFSTLLVDQSSHAINSSFIMIKSNVILFCWFSLIHITFANRPRTFANWQFAKWHVCEVTGYRTIGVFGSYPSETWRSASSKANHWDHKMYLNNQKRHTAFLFFLEEELPLSRFRQGSSISIKIEQFYYPRANFHQNCSQRFNTSQPQPRCHVCAVTNPIWRREL